MYIADQESFDAFAARAREARVLAIDTEFLRESTYYPQLCLLQLSADDDVAVVDPFEVRDFSALEPSFTDEGIVKLFHAGGQDLEILLHVMGMLPRPIFDTQIAAAVLGHTQQIGLASLVQAELGVSLRKMESFTDWSQRPLSESQLRYAAEDVIYLPQLYEKMHAKLVEKNRLGWLDREFAELSDPAHFQVDERARYRRLRRVGQLSRRQLAAAREVAAWRELEAQRRDIPRKWVVTDEQVVEACKREARTLNDLYMVRGMREKLPVRDARAVLELIASALDSPPDSWPESDRPGRSEPNVDLAIDLMTALVRLRSRESGIAMPTLASHDDLARIARGYRKGVDLLRGWRRSIVGEELLELLDGRIRLSMRGNELVVERVADEG